MTTPGTVDVPALLAAGAASRADQPLLTYHDGLTGERTALTATQLGGWAARTAGLLRDGCALDSGSRAAVLLPPHWPTAAVLLAPLAVGASVVVCANLDPDRLDEHVAAEHITRPL